MGEVAKGQRTLVSVIKEIYDTGDPEEVSRRFVEAEASRVAFRERTVEVLETLRGKYMLILCSDTTGIAKEVVKKLEISKFFDAIFYSCDMGFLKSEEKFWVEVMGCFPGSEPRNFLVVGDNVRSDTYQPNRLGMHTVLIANPVKLSFDYREMPARCSDEEPECSIMKLGELLPLLA